MSRCGIFAAIFLIGCTTGVYSQFYDFYQALQPLVQSYSTLTDHPFEHFPTTKRPRTTVRHKTEQTNKSTGTRRNPVAISGLEEPSRDNSRNREKATTVKPVRKTSKPQSTNQRPKGNSRNIAREIATQKDPTRNPSRIIFEEPVISANTYYDTGNGKGSKAIYTTQNPFFNRPGVKPAPVDDRRPPITNRPQTIKPRPTESIEFSRPQTTKPRPTESIEFNRPQIIESETSPDRFISPEMIIGPDEDNMSDVERRRYIELAERMCDKYKNLNTKQLQAIPLVPSPEPVQINITSCVPSNVPLVVGGKVVSIKEFPHMALLGWLRLHSSGYAWRCGGSLISSQFVLTAAHCAYDERDNSIVRGPPRVVQLGSSYLDDPGALVMKVASVVRHPKYVQPKSYYDVALVKLSASVTFSEVIRPACLGVPPRAGESVIATGWGRTEFGGDLSNELRSVSIPVWKDNECAQILGTSRRLPSGQSPDSQICAGERKGGKDTCQGDSGGPAQIQDGCVWRVVAVTSLGRACGAPDTPALYAKVQRAFVASVAFGKLIPNDGNNIRYTTEGTYNGGGNANIRNTNKQTTDKTHNNVGGNNNQWDNNNRQTTSNNRGTDNSAVNNHRQVNGRDSNNNGGKINSDVSYNNQRTNNNRQTTSNNRGIDNVAISNHRQVNNEGFNVNSGSNHNNQRNSNRQTERQTTERNINRNTNQQNGGNYNINTQSNNVQKRNRNFNTNFMQTENNNNNFGLPYNNPFYNSQPIWT